MFYNDHEPPHFHAERQGLQEAMLHRSELEQNWHLMKAGQPLRQIAPLE